MTQTHTYVLEKGRPLLQGPYGQGSLWKEHKSQLVGRKLRAASGFWPSCCEGPQTFIPEFCHRDPANHPGLTLQDEEQSLSADLSLAHERVDNALLDSINLSGAMHALFDLVRSANRYMAEREASAAKDGGAQKSIHPAICST